MHRTKKGKKNSVFRRSVKRTVKRTIKSTKTRRSNTKGRDAKGQNTKGQNTKGRNTKGRDAKDPYKRSNRTKKIFGGDGPYATENLIVNVLHPFQTALKSRYTS